MHVLGSNELIEDVFKRDLGTAATPCPSVLLLQKPQGKNRQAVSL